METTSPPSPVRKFRFLLLTASNNALDNVDCTKSRIQHFSSLTGGQDSALIFLLYSAHTPTTENGFATAKHLNSNTINGFQAYLTFQSQLLQSTIPLPLLPLGSPSSLPQILTTFMDSAAKVVKAPPIPNAATDLLPYCTTNPPLDQLTVTVLSDLFPCLRDFAEFDRDCDLMPMIEVLARNGANEQTIGGVVDFWTSQRVLHS